MRDVTPATSPSNGNTEPEKVATTQTVHGPSFLGLAEDPKTEFHYLYEDEPPRSYAGLLFAVILLAAIGVAGFWQWRHHGFPFNRFGGSTSAQQSASPSEVAPAQSQDQQTHIDKPMTGAGDVLPTEPAQNKPPDTGKATEFPAQGGEAPASGTASPKTANAGQEVPSNEAAPEKPAEEARATPPSSVTPSHARKVDRKPVEKPAPKAAAVAPTAKTSPDADLEAAGERYLYGSGGTPANCAKAESSLRTAATHGNSKAQTVLGTMYATGHCVGRDLPTAYRWFARALRQDPQNSRISADLQVLWRQMSAPERQLATANGQ